MSTGKRRLDPRDIAILEIIQQHGRIPKKALAQAVGLSLTPCYHRLQRLEADGFVTGYRGVVDPQRLGTFLWICTDITLSRHRAADLAKFETAVQEIAEILECDAVGGGIDYVLKFVVRNIAHYQSIIESLLDQDLGVATYFTYVVTRRVKHSQGLPLSALLKVPKKD
jgi:Lrp/AsnC family transcriptional regulator, regulator of ectoine-degradation genes